MLNRDEKIRAISLERLLPGKSLKDLFAENKDRAVEIAIEVLQKLAQATPEKKGFPGIEVWFTAFKKAETTVFPSDILYEAQKTLCKLEALSTESRVIHGDFHHENILSDGREHFRVIDPKGVIGNIGYEISVFLNNHLKWIENKQDIGIPVDQFSQAFDISPRTLKEWVLFSKYRDLDWGARNWQKHLDCLEIWI